MTIKTLLHLLSQPEWGNHPIRIARCLSAGDTNAGFGVNFQYECIKAVNITKLGTLEFETCSKQWLTTDMFLYEIKNRLLDRLQKFGHETWLDDLESSADVEAVGFHVDLGVVLLEELPT